VVPFDLVKVRLQASNSRALYANTLDAVFKIFRSEGLLAFYKGFESTLWRHGIWNGGYFATIFTIRDALPKAQTQTGDLFRNFVAGTIAGTVGTALNTPTDVVKSRVQNQDAVCVLCLYFILSKLRMDTNTSIGAKTRTTSQVQLDLAICLSDCQRRRSRGPLQRLCAESTATGTRWWHSAGGLHFCQ